MKQIPIVRLLLVAIFALATGAVWAADFIWTGTAGGRWGGRDWNDGFLFPIGGNAVFTNAASVLLDGDVVVNRIEARENTAILPGAIDPDAWKTAYRHYRFCVDAPRSNRDSMQLSDVMLLDKDGNEILSTAFALSYDSDKYDLYEPYPGGENPANAVDGNHETKWLDWRAGASRTAVQRAAVYLEFNFSEAVSLSGYRWYTANDSDDRDPAAWRLLGSHDGETWIVLDKVEGYNAPKFNDSDRKALAFQRSFSGFTKYRFKVDETRETNDPMMQLSDISLYGEDGALLLNGVDFDISWDADMKGTYNNYGESGTETPRHAVDTTEGSGNVNTKWLDWRIQDHPGNVWIQFDMNKPVNISAYSWSTANDATGRDPRDWRLLGSADNGVTWAPVDAPQNMTITQDRCVLAYRKTFSVGKMRLAVGELNVAEGKTLSIQGVIDVSSGAGLFKKGAGALSLGGEGDITINPGNGFEICEGTLSATDAALRLGGTATANCDAPFVVGNGGSATAVLDGGSVYCVSVESGDYNAMQLGANAGDKGYLYATNVNVVSRGRIRLATGEGSFALVDKAGGDWLVQENLDYGRFYMGRGKNSSSEFYHRGGTLETWSYFRIGTSDESMTGRNYFELSGGTVTQGHEGDVSVGYKGGADTVNELRVIDGTFNAHADINVGGGASGTLTVDGGEVNAGSGRVVLSGSNDAGETGTVALNGGVLLTKGVVHGGGAERGFLKFDGGMLKASAAGTLIGGGESLDVSVGASGATVGNNGFDVTVECAMRSGEEPGVVTFAGTGTTALAADQGDSRLSFVVSEGALKVDGGVSVGSAIKVAGGARLVGSVLVNDASLISDLTFEEGAAIGLSASASGIEAGRLVMPADGTVTLVASNGDPLGMGRYVVVSGADVSEGIEAKFAPSVADDLYPSFSVEDGTLVLTVTGGNEAVWTGSVDGDMSNPDNWFLKMTPNGRPVIINVETESVLTCPETISPTSIVFAKGSAAVTINRENGASFSGVVEVINLSSHVQTVNVPVIFAGDVTVNYSDFPVDFAGGATGRTLVLGGKEDQGWHLKGTFNLEAWSDAPYCFIDAGTTVNADTASNFGDMRIEEGGRVVVGDYTLDASDSNSSDRWVLYSNKGHFIVTNALTNISSVRTSMYSGDGDAPCGGTVVIEHFANTPAADVKFLLGKYGDIGTGYAQWANGKYQFGTLTWGERASAISGRRQCAPGIYFAKSGTIKAVAEGQNLAFLEAVTFNACDIEGNPSDITLDCDISYEDWNSSGSYGHVVFAGGGRFVLAAGRTVERCDKRDTRVKVEGGTTLALMPGSNVKAPFSLSVQSGSVLELAKSGTVSFDAPLRLDDGACLAFNFTQRNLDPVLQMSDGKNVDFGEGKSIKVAVSSATRPISGRHVLTSSGGKFEGVTVSPAANAPGWVRDIAVENGEIVLDVKPAGTRITVR